MIPLKLTLRNFMCYRETAVLSFEGLHVACLTGENGHGKSALLEALTWALWGRTRLGEDADGLIHAGQADLSVELEFEAGDRRYLVVRKREGPRANRPGRSELQLFILAPEGQPRALSGNTQGETQQKIIELLHLTYDTFINSAFLVQGRADEFTKKRAGDRKAVLGDILGLAEYDRYADRAREEVREREKNERAATLAIETVDRELAARPAAEAALARLQPELDALVKEGALRDAAAAVLRGESERFAALSARVGDLERRVGQVRRELADGMRRADEAQARIRELEQTLSRREEIEAGYQKLKELQKVNAELNLKADEVRVISEQVNQLNNAIADAKRKADSDRDRYSHLVSESQARAANIPVLEKAQVEAAAHRTALALREKALLEKDESARRGAQALAALRQQAQQLAAEVAEAGEKLALLGHGENRCPLCETELGSEGLQRLADKLRRELEGWQVRVKENQSAAAAQETALAALKKETAGHEALQREARELEKKAGQDEEQLRLARESAALVEKYQRDLMAVSEAIERRSYATEEQARRKTLEEQYRKLDYDPKFHKEVRSRIKEYEPYESAWQQLAQASGVLEGARAEAAALREGLEKLRATLADDDDRLKALKAEAGALADTPAKLAAVEAARMKLAAEERRLRDGQAALEEKLRGFTRLEATRAENAAALTRLANEKTTYERLAEAFGKKGVQALLVEQSIPEIEIEANQLLYRMTDGRMVLKLETQREKKSGKGGTIETLDIVIADELGYVRDYETYSGGEAFRINLALRIALSRLLVRRAGAALPILIIDEGFGTQDATGREKLVEAITSIQRDFRLIIVITHLEDLKDAFPARITVTKTDEGSKIEVA
jgi:exonuclease SbcC